MIYFQDTFDDGTFNAWTSTTGTGIAISNAYFLSSPDSMHISDNTSWATKNVTVSGTTDVRVYFRIPTTLPASGDIWNFIQFGDTDFTNNFCNMRINYDGVNYHWHFTYWLDGTGYVIVDSIFIPDQSHWYCVEVQIVTGASGTYKVWIDATLIFSISAANTQLTNNGDVNVGAVTGSSIGTCDYYIDNVVIANTYIGPIVTKKAPSRTMVGDGLSFMLI